MFEHANCCFIILKKAAVLTRKFIFPSKFQPITFVLKAKSHQEVLNSILELKSQTGNFLCISL